MREPNPLFLKLSRRIEQTGPLSIADFMAEANGHYYDSRDPFGADGDFITAPEISQMFGEMIGLWSADLWLRSRSPANAAYVELGPGRGTLAADALRAMEQFDFVPDVHFVETSTALRQAQQLRVPQARWHESVATLPADRPLIVIANEFFDALPIRQMVSTHSGWRERVVGRHQDRLIAMPGSKPVDDFVPEVLRRQPPGIVAESAPAATVLMEELADRLATQGGAMLIIDYGYEGPRAGDTLQAVKRHQTVDVFANLGEQDLTAHVDFANLRELAMAQGLAASNIVAQGPFLDALGLHARAEALVNENPTREAEIVAQYRRLTDEYEMGTLFKAMALTAPGWPTPEGFA